MPTVQQIIILHDQFVTSAIGRYKSRLEQVVADAIALTLSELHRKLTLDSGGRIASTAGNQRVLRSIDSIFAAKMEAAGFPALSEAFAKSFAGQLPFLDDILDTLSAQLNTPLPDVREVIGAEERRLLASQQLSTIDSLQSVVDQVASIAKQQALFGVAGMPVSNLAVIMSRAMNRTVAQASAIAETAQVAFFRTMSDTAYAKIEDDLPQFKIEYQYYGPLDDLNRPVCRLWESQSRAGKRWSRADIDNLDNGAGQPKPVRIFCGGIRCRHMWLIAL